jgi:uncharacterized protein YndB with AHSA1/START domain
VDETDKVEAEGEGADDEELEEAGGGTGSPAEATAASWKMDDRRAASACAASRGWPAVLDPRSSVGVGATWL